MANEKEQNESRLGHDPLEWLEEEDASEDVKLSEASTTDKESATPVENETSSEAEVETVADTTLDDDEEIIDEELAPADVETEAAASENVETDEVESLPATFSGEYVLPEQLKVQDVEVLHAQWLSTIDIAAGNDVVINAESVAKIDTAGVQLVYALSKTLQSKGCNIRLSSSQTFDQEVRLTGLGTYFSGLAS